MATLRTVTVKSSGGDYSSLSAAFVGEVGSLVALDRKLQIDCYNFHDTTFAETGAGWATDATRFILVNTVDNHQGIYGGVGEASAYSVDGLWIDTPFTRLQGVSAGLALSSTAALQFNSGASSGIADYCIVRNTAANGICFNGFDTAYFRNCLAIIPTLSSGAGFQFSSLCTFHNCTSAGASVGFLNGGVTAGVAINCAAIGGTTSSIGFSGPDWTGSSNCASTDATVPTSGAGHRANQAILLYNPGAGDYHLDASDVGAKGFGADLSADPTLPFSIDITGAARTVPWDIGAFLPTGTASFGYLLEYVRLILEDGSGAYATEDASGALLNEISANSDTTDRLILEDSSGVIALESQPISAAVAASSEDSSATVGAERFVGPATASSEDSSAVAGAERYAGTTTASSEDSSAVAGAERLVATATGSSEDAAAVVGAERVVAATTGSTEDSSTATGAERFAATATGSSEDSTLAAGAERFVASATASSEDSADASDVERDAGSVAASSETSAVAVGSSTVSATVDASSETPADAVGVVTNPTGRAGHGGGGKAGKPVYRMPDWPLASHRFTTRVTVGAESSADVVGSVRIPAVASAGSSASAASRGRVRYVSRAAATSETSAAATGDASDDELALALYAAYEMYVGFDDADADLEMV